MKYIKKFNTTILYNNAALDLPNVSLTMDNREVHYNPYDGRLVAKYNVTSTSSATSILGSSSNISAIEIDGTTLNSVVTSYTFSTTGIHTVKYTLTNNTNIGDSTFFYCSSLTSITIPDGVTSINDHAFQKCSAMTGVTIPNSVTSIGSSAFNGCSSLTSVTIPNSVTSISQSAFNGCSSLTSMTIPNSVTSIGNNAFNNCSGLTTVTIPNSVTSIGIYTFYGCSGLTSVTIPNSVTSIGEYTFYNCSSLTSLTIGNSVTSIGDEAFSGTAWYNSQPDGLVYAGKVAYAYKGTMPANTSISLQEGTLGIAISAFYGCSGLKSLTIPNSVTSIGEYAFNNCTNLTTLIVQATTPPTLGTDALTDTNTNLIIKVPSASVNTYKAASGWSSYSSRIQAI